MDLSLLDTLRYKIDTVKNLSEAFEYFFDHFAEHREFLTCGQLAEDPMLTQLLTHIGGTVLKTTRVKLEGLRTVRIEEYNFIHGGLTINGAIATVIYFDDIRKGILAMQQRGRQATDFVRFTAEMLPRDLVKKSAHFDQ